MATWTQLEERSVRSVQALTETPPAPLDPSTGVGLVIDSVRGLSFYLDAGDGFTITADTGQVDVYFHDAGLWSYAPALSFKVPTGSAGKRRVLVGMVPITNPRGRVAMFTNGILAGNTTVALDALASNIGGRK